MSIFRPISLPCPSCQAKVGFQAVHSVNADRRPDLRADILAQTFQQERCPACGAQFRLDPEFNLMDTKRGQWVAAAPLAKLSDWVEVEKHARELFDRAHGPESNPMAQEIGKGLTPRITFGWPALREKLLVSEYGLDDVVLELCKMFIMRNSDSPISAETELRLIDVVDADLVMGWTIAADGTPGPSMRLARTVYDQIAEDEEGDWEDLAANFDDVLFVDLNRLLMDRKPKAPSVAETTEGVPEPPVEEPAPVEAVEDEEEEVLDMEDDEAEESDAGDSGNDDSGTAPK